MSPLGSYRDLAIRRVRVHVLFHPIESPNNLLTSCRRNHRGVHSGAQAFTVRFHFINSHGSRMLILQVLLKLRCCGPSPNPTHPPHPDSVCYRHTGPNSSLILGPDSSTHVPGNSDELFQRKPPLPFPSLGAPRRDTPSLVVEVVIH
jgi:hypothetical protein